MFDERELAGLTDQLSDYILTSQHHRDGQDKLVGNFQQLITDYRQLRSDYEEEKESREKYKQLARGQERDPFVLVLVDGDSYIVSTVLICFLNSNTRKKKRLTSSSSATNTSKPVPVVV
jgi:hypothetical protein